MDYAYGLHGGYGVQARRDHVLSGGGPTPDEDGRTLISYVICHGELDTFNVMLERGWEIHEGRPYHPDSQSVGWTPLYYAARCGNYEMVKRLLEQGANPNLLTPFGWTALGLTLNYVDVISIGRPSELRLKLIKILLTHGASPNRPQGPNKINDVHQLIHQCQNVSEVKLLLKAGAVVTELHYRRHLTQPDMYELLITHAPRYLLEQDNDTSLEHRNMRMKELRRRSTYASVLYYYIPDQDASRLCIEYRS